MKSQPHFLLLIAFVMTFIGFVIFTGSKQNHAHAAYALPANSRSSQADATPPRNIFVNEPDCMANSSEHIRFGAETSHYFQFFGKRDQWYKVKTQIFSSAPNSISIDTKLLVYRRNPLEHPNENPIASNDDKDAGATIAVLASELDFLATEDGQYWIEVQNLVSDGRGSYCLRVTRINEATEGQVPDRCEFNNTINTACEIEIMAQVPTPTPTPGASEPVKFPTELPTPPPAGSFLYNFVPTGGQNPDLDFYKLWVKKGQTYICQTYNLSLGNDTNIIFFDGNGDDFEPNLGNDDIAPGNKASKLSVTPHYNGWLYILVNPHVEIDPEQAAQYTYRLACVNELVPTPASDRTATDPDVCEVNDSFNLASACQILLKPVKKDPSNPNKVTGIEGVRGEGDIDKHRLNFAPWRSGVRDVDHFRLWSKAGWRYACYTDQLQNGNDTKMTLFYAHNGTMIPGNNPNDDHLPNGDLGSRVEVGIEHSRTGWIIIKVEPVMNYIFEDGGLYQYRLVCEAFPPPDASLDNLNSPGVDGVATRSPDDVRQQAPESESGVAVAGTPVPSGKTAVSFVPIAAPAPTPIAASMNQPASLTMQLYYDKNNNHVKETDEGIAHMPVYIYNGLSSQPIETTTTAGGAIFVKTGTAQGEIQVVIPYLNINQQISVTDEQDIRLRVSSR